MAVLATVTEFFNTLSGVVLILFITSLIIILVYHWDSLRRER